MRKGSTLGGDLVHISQPQLSTRRNTHNSAIFERSEEFAGLAAGWV
jgi:hypothetical protein